MRFSPGVLNRQSAVSIIARMLLVLLMLAPGHAFASSTLRPAHAPAGYDVQAFLDRQPGVLKSYTDGTYRASEVIQGYAIYYSLDARIVLTLLELVPHLITEPKPDQKLLAQPFGDRGPDGFRAQIDWAARELRAGFGPYTQPPVVRFTDGTTATLALDQDPSVIAVQRFLAQGRTEAEWTRLKDAYRPLFQRLFGAEPEAVTPVPRPPAARPFLQLPWPEVYPAVKGDPLSGKPVEMVHSSYFDHVYPTVDRGDDGNSFMVNYKNQGNLSYNTHDGHDYYFTHRPIGTPILAAAGGIAYAWTARGNGVVIRHEGPYAGYETVYWHLDKFASKFNGKIDNGAGIRVRPGDVLGTSGKTGFTDGGAHLHFEVRHNGKQVDPYGWFGPGADPCARWVAGCEASVWLWADKLRGKYDLTPPTVDAPTDSEPPIGTLSILRDDELSLLAHFDGHPVQSIGAGAPTFHGRDMALLPYEAGVFERALRVPPGATLMYPISNNLSLEEGTLAMWVNLPGEYPRSTTGRHYLFAASANPGDAAGSVYTGTLALRREIVEDSDPEQVQWNFWTVDDEGARHDLIVPDTLDAGWHHVAIGWKKADDGRVTKQVYIDGNLKGTAAGAPFPTFVGSQLEIGRWTTGFGDSDIAVDELMITRRSLSGAEVRDLAEKRDYRSGKEGPLGQDVVVASPPVILDTNAIDMQGGIVGVRLRRNDEPWSDPAPYYDSYRWAISGTEGLHTFAVEYRDRADNVSVVTQTVRLVAPPEGTVELVEADDLASTLHFERANDDVIEVQVSRDPDFAGAPWRPFAAERPWSWQPGSPRIAYVRFRSRDGIIGQTIIVGPDVRQTYLPWVER